MRIGVDLGGTKIEGVVLGDRSDILSRHRIPTPQHDYHGTLNSIVDLVGQLEADCGIGALSLPVGIGAPGSISHLTGRMKNCNSTCLNGQALREDLQALLKRDIRIANDADCFALSEAKDGAARGASSVFGVILGTGVGGGIVLNNQLLSGPNGIAGEWGHNPIASVFLEGFNRATVTVGEIIALKLGYLGRLLNKATGSARIEPLAQRKSPVLRRKAML